MTEEIQLDERLILFEALLFASERPVSPKKVIQFLGKSAKADLLKLVENLNDSFAESGRSFRVREIAGGYQLYLMPTYAGAVEKFLRKQRERRLSQAALETLAVVAYKQPVSRADVEHVRGVNSDGVLASLLERKLTAIVGRSQKVGRPLLYGTTERFLEYFGLKTLDDLPRLDELVLPDDGILSENQVELSFGNDKSTDVDESETPELAEINAHSDKNSAI